MVSTFFERQGDGVGDGDSNSNPNRFLPLRLLEEGGGQNETVTNGYEYSTYVPLYHVGMALNSLVLLACILSIVFIVKFRQHRVLSMAQPLFLVMICLGSFSIGISGLVLDSSGYLTRYGAPQQDFDNMCGEFAWEFFYGNLFVYMSLFGKTWRLVKVTQFRRNQVVKIKHVIWPLILVLVLYLGVFTAWMLVSPPVWKMRDIVKERVVIRSVGYCDFTHGSYAFILVLLLLMLSCALLGFWMSRKIPKKIPEELNDGKEIRKVYLIHFGILLCFGVVYFVGRHYGIKNLMAIVTIFLVFPFSFTNIALLIAPKCYSVWYEKKHGGNLPGRIGSGNVVVTGINTTTAATTTASTRTSSENGAEFATSDTHGDNDSPA